MEEKVKLYQFDNGYGVTIIRKYGGYELAVLEKGRITYDTAITSDVIDCFTVEEAEKYISLIERLDMNTVVIDQMFLYNKYWDVKYQVYSLGNIYVYIEPRSNKYGYDRYSIHYCVDGSVRYQLNGYRCCKSDLPIDVDYVKKIIDDGIKKRRSKSV